MQYIASALANLSIKHGFTLVGKKIGIVGVGHVGSKVARLAKILGMIPLLNDPPRQRVEHTSGFVSLEEIRETSDIITFHVPLNMVGIDRTFHLADHAFFQKLKRKPWIINTSRGAVVDTVSVKEAIKRGLISGFAADVWEKEPGLDLELMEITEIATPHIAGYSVEGKANGTAACVSAASRFFGFGLDDWYPPFIPPPLNPIIHLDATGKSDEQILAETILASYDVMQDDETLRNDPSGFENLRNYYPARREFEAFSVEVKKSEKLIFKRLHDLGFDVSR
jgi:erythronate-4-phosphate dehydrogenase